MQSLFESGDGSRRSLDDAEQRVEDLDANFDAATHTISVIRSSLAASEADIARAEEGLNNTIVVAPMAGVITELHMEVGEQVLGTFNNIGNGATRRQLLSAFAVEYAILGLATALFAVIAGALSAWGVIHFIMEMPWSFSASVAGVTGLSAMAVTVATCSRAS